MMQELDLLLKILKMKEHRPQTGTTGTTLMLIKTTEETTIVDFTLRMR